MSCASPKMYKLTILARRKAGMSEKEFQEYWTNIHASKVSEWLKKHGIVRYTQYHTPSWVRAKAAEELESLGKFATTNTTDYDGFVELVMPDLKCYENARKDPYYEKVVKPDEESFFDLSKSSLTVGWEETYV